MQVIIYLQDNNVTAVVYPTPEALKLFDIDEIAKKDVPTGKPYKIIDSDDLPTDRTQRSKWTVDTKELTDGVGE